MVLSGVFIQYHQEPIYIHPSKGVEHKVCASMHLLLTRKPTLV